MPRCYEFGIASDREGKERRSFTALRNYGANSWIRQANLEHDNYVMRASYYIENGLGLIFIIKLVDILDVLPAVGSSTDRVPMPSRGSGGGGSDRILCGD